MILADLTEKAGTDPAYDLWQLSYAKPSANWHRHVRIFRHREEGASWAEIARDHGLRRSAPKRSYGVVAEHLEKLAESGGAITPDMTLARCPGITRRLVNALERNGILTLREAACCREEDLRRMPWLGRLGIEELKRLMEIAEPW